MAHDVWGLVRQAAVLVAILLALPLNACSKIGEEPLMTLTLEQAKMEVWETEEELVAIVPKGAVIKRSARVETSKVLFECGEAGRYYWPGAVRLEILRETDSGAVISAIYNSWVTRPEWKVEWLDQGPERYQLDLLRTDGLHVSVLNLKDNAGIQFNSFSPCFDLAEYDPNKSY